MNYQYCNHNPNNTKRHQITCLRLRGNIAPLQLQRGIAVIELAITLPALLVILFATAEFTRVFYQYNTLTTSVRDGARFIAQNSLSGNLPVNVPANVLTETRNLVVAGNPSGGQALLPGLSEDDVDIQFSSAGGTGINRYYVTVSADYQYLPLAPILNSLNFLSDDIDLSFTLTALSSMRSQ